MSTRIIILAAGASTRMGRPKQLLRFAGTTLLRHAAQTALASRAQSISVVVGANECATRAELQGLPVQIISNPNWQTGMGSSIQLGVAEAKSDSEIGTAILTLADQPYLTPQTYNRIIAAHFASRLPIVASHYSGTVGVPALFERQFFDSLLALGPDQGCKNLILANATKSMRLPCPEAAMDVDNPEDYEKLIHSGA